jgi:hypothetical protein
MAVIYTNLQYIFNKIKVGYSIGQANLRLNDENSNASDKDKLFAKFGLFTAEYPSLLYNYFLGGAKYWTEQLNNEENTVHKEEIVAKISDFTGKLYQNIFYQNSYSGVSYENLMTDPVDVMINNYIHNPHDLVAAEKIEKSLNKITHIIHYTQELNNYTLKILEYRDNLAKLEKTQTISEKDFIKLKLQIIKPSLEYANKPLDPYTEEALKALEYITDFESSMNSAYGAASTDYEHAKQEIMSITQELLGEFKSYSIE